MSHYLLHCSISATVRQSVQIKYEDLSLPQSVIDTLENSNAVSVRPNLSNALKEELDALRVMQRELYDDFCIHFGDSHFVTSAYFEDAKQLIGRIRNQAKEANQRLAGMWSDEFARWKDTAEGILRPLFKDDESYHLAVDAYLRIFPTKEEYSTPINVYVLGPLPVSLTKVDKPVDGASLDEILAYENAVNTKEVLEAAKAQAADKALTMGAELIDDLDCRNAAKVGKQQTGSDKRRGSWEITAAKLKLISDSVPGFENLATLADTLLQTGKDMMDNNRSVRDKATQRFYELQSEIKQELGVICANRNTSKGLDKLQRSLALSNEYKTLCEKIKTAENINALNLLSKDVSIEIDIYEQRGKHLRKLMEQRKELIKCASGEGLDELLSEVTEADF